MKHQLSLNDKTRKDYNEFLELGLIFCNQMAQKLKFENQEQFTVLALWRESSIV